MKNNKKTIITIPKGMDRDLHILNEFIRRHAVNGRLGFFEKLQLKRLGRVDGKEGIPREEGGHWVTPFLQSEEARVHEYSCRVWAEAEVYCEKGYAHLEATMDQVQKDMQRIDEIRGKIAAAAEKEAQRTSCRYVGEDTLDAQQVHQRRAAEAEKALVPLRERLVELLTSTSPTRQSFLYSYRLLREAEGGIQLIVERAHNRARQRISYYWRALLASYTGAEVLPVTIPYAALDDTVKGRYIDVNHKRLTERAESLIDQAIALEQEV